MTKKRYSAEVFEFLFEGSEMSLYSKTKSKTWVFYLVKFEENIFKHSIYYTISILPLLWFTDLYNLLALDVNILGMWTI